MAKLSAVTADPAATDEGDWIDILECDDLRIRSRGYTDRYHDALRTKLQRAARAYGGDVSRVPEGIRRKLSTEALMDHVTLDVENLEGVDIAKLKEMVFEAKFRPLLDHCYTAANIMQARREADLEEAGPSFASPSAAPSNGAPEAPQA